MKGKKSNPQFISEFISKCIINGINTPSNILNAAQLEIENINIKIKEVENLKITRSNLLDVVERFNESSIKNNESEVLPMFTISNIISKKICNLLKSSDIQFPILINENNFDVNFCIKQLLEQKIINRIDDKLCKGDRYNLYMSNVFQETS